MPAPRFDSPACFAALLGERRHGRWLLAPSDPVRRTRRRYREATLILETEFETQTGVVRVTDCMPLGKNQHCHVLRVVEGLAGEVAMRMELIIRFDYGSVVPWVQRSGHALTATAGPDTLELRTPAQIRGEDQTTLAEFVVRQGERVPFVLSYRASHLRAHTGVAAEAALEATEKWWRDWSARCTYTGPWREPVLRSLITLKALTYQSTGGIIAAPTTSLPEQLGGVRNWDYRYCWLRDATFTLYALLYSGYRDEAKAWREWLLRAVAGRPQDLQILYGISGERRLPEAGIPWLPGYEGSAPVRIGNAATSQYQLDVYGEVLDTFHLMRCVGVAAHTRTWNVHRVLLDFLESNWERPDEGIWEVRGPRRHFTHSRVMAWVAFDRAVKAVERFGLSGELERWRAVRAAVHAQVCREGFDAQRNTFVQYVRLEESGRERADDSSGGVSSGRGPARAWNPRGHPVRTRGRRPDPAIFDGRSHRRTAARGRGVPAVLVLARRQPGDGRPPRRSHGAVRAAAVPVQRRRPHRRGVRHGAAASGR